MKQTILFTILVSTALLSSGCASLFNGNKQALTIKTNSDAEIFIDDRFAGTGTTIRKVSRDQTHTIRVELGSCQNSYQTQAEFNKISLLGLFVDVGLVSIPVDFLSGAAWKIHPSKLYLPLTCQETEALKETR